MRALIGLSLAHSAQGQGLATVELTASGALYNGTTYDSHDLAIQAAINAVSQGGGGTVQLGAGVYDDLDSSIYLRSNVMLQGAGQGQTILKDSLAGDAQIATDPDTKLENAGISSLSIDGENRVGGSGMKVHNFDNFTVTDVTIQNIADAGWGANFGVVDTVAQDQTGAVRNDGLTISGLTIDGHQDSSLESVVIFNTNNVEGSIHIENRNDGPGVGLWQNVDGAQLTVTGKDTTAGELLYYSYSTENLDLNVSGDNVNRLIGGGKESDYGRFGYERIEGVKITASGTGSGEAGAGVQLGALYDAEVIIGTLENFQVPIRVDGGESETYKYPTNFFTITLGNILNANPTGESPGAHPGILFAEVGTLNGIVKNGSITTDDGKMLFPIAFDDSAADHLFVANTTLSPGAGGQSVNLSPNATVGSNVWFDNIPSPVINDGTLTSHFITPAQMVDYAQHTGIDMSNAVALSGAGDGILALQNPFGLGTELFDITISNSGAIDVLGIAIHAQSLASNGDAAGEGHIYVTNSGQASGAMAGIVAEAHAGNAYINNSGAVTATDTDAIAIKTAGGDDVVTNMATGVLDADVAVSTGDGADQALLAGQVYGDVLLGAGNDMLHLQAGLDFDGLADGGADTDTVRLSLSGPMDVGRLQNFETLRVDGAATLTGTQTFTDAVFFEGADITLHGTQLVSGLTTLTAASSVRVTQSATVQGDVVQQGALAVDLGQSLSVDGDYTVASGGLVTLGFSEANTATLEATGALIFAEGAILALDVRSNDDILNGTDIVVAEGSSVSFDGTVTENSVLYDLVEVIVGGQLYVRVQQDQAIAMVVQPLGPNRTVVGGVLDKLFLAGELADVNRTFGQLTTQTAVQDLLSDLTPGDAMTGHRSLQGHMDAMGQTLGQRFDRQDLSFGLASAGPQSLGWYQAQGVRSVIEGQEGQGGSETDTRLQFFGFERVFASNLGMGLGLGLSESSAQGTGLNDHQAYSGDGRHLALYTSGMRGTTRLSAAIQAARMDMDSTRTIAALGETATGTFEVAGYGLHIAADRPMALGGVLSGWQGVAGLDVYASQTQRSAYAETGSSANLSFSAHEWESAQATARIRLIRDATLWGRETRPEITLGVSTGLSGSSDAWQVQFVDAGDPFTLQTTHLNTESLEAQITLPFVVGVGRVLTADLSHRQGAGGSQTQASVTLNMVF